MKYSIDIHQYESQNAQGNLARPAQDNLLDIMQDEEMTQAEICSRTGKSRSTVSRQIKQLEAAGYVVRMPSGKYRKKE